MLNAIYRDMALKKALIYRILKAVKVGKDATNQGGRLTKKFFITPQLVASFSASVQAAKVINHLSYSSDFAPEKFTTSPKLKRELGGVSMMPESFKRERCRPLRSTMKEEFGTVFVRSLKGCE